ncbi:uroporphyrinogen-III synthase [Pseudorhodobacter ferrugineus]|uniref:uroporphyrinogen-III synthase n=1 Tax=Pseudorhodobacter ferrugineus TaxID=77008 RepID=UPI0003B3A3AF|nr:uroporphyrinogen-III synthase [Pseudorhodobacter ferrugineus]
MATQSRLPAFLLTRPAAQSNRFAGQLRQRFGQDIEVTISPLIAPRFVNAALPAGPFDALIFTSETGVMAFQTLKPRPETMPKLAYCVGKRTAKAALLAGLEPVSADGDASDLITFIGKQGPARLLHICGAHSRGNVAQRLTDSGLKTDICVLYEQVEQPLSSSAIDLLQGEMPVVVPLFSPRSAALFCQNVSFLTPLAPLTFAALSKAVGEELLKLTPVNLCYANQPNAVSLLDAISGFYAAS